jgi:hypothetical protein
MAAEATKPEFTDTATAVADHDTLPPGIVELLSAGKARWNGRRLSLPEPVTLQGDGPLASDYVIEGRR